jgi:hypothetical protein
MGRPPGQFFLKATGVMSRDDAAAEQAPLTKPLTIEEKIEAWTGWDDSKWQPDWMKVYNKSVTWAAGGGLAGALHALSTGRSVIPNTILFAGYTTVLAGAYYSSREAIFGREIERFRQESLALGLPETVARDYPWRWDIMCGGIAGAVAGAMGGHKPAIIAASAALFSGGILAIRISSNAFSDYVLPVMLPDEYKRLERGRQRIIMTEHEIAEYERAQEEAALEKKSWIWQMMPSWSPVQVYTPKEHRKMKEDQEYDAWLLREVESKRLEVGIKRKVKDLEESGGAARLSNPESSNANLTPRPASSPSKQSL